MHDRHELVRVAHNSHLPDFHLLLFLMNDAMPQYVEQTCLCVSMHQKQQPPPPSPQPDARLCAVCGLTCAAKSRNGFVMVDRVGEDACHGRYLIVFGHASVLKGCVVDACQRAGLAPLAHRDCVRMHQRQRPPPPSPPQQPPPPPPSSLPPSLPPHPTSPPLLPPPLLPPSTSSSSLPTSAATPPPPSLQPATLPPSLHVKTLEQQPPPPSLPPKLDDLHHDQVSPCPSPPPSPPLQPPLPPSPPRPSPPTPPQQPQQPPPTFTAHKCWQCGALQQPGGYTQVAPHLPSPLSSARREHLDTVKSHLCSSVDHHQPEQPVSLPGAPQPQVDNEAELARVAHFQEHFRELDQALTALQPLPGPPAQPTGTPLRLFGLLCLSLVCHRSRRHLKCKCCLRHAAKSAAACC
ncbi:hypothetical protein V8C86DRAFT_1335963 [Haematococcus lacustris]